MTSRWFLRGAMAATCVFAGSGLRAQQTVAERTEHTVEPITTTVLSRPVTVTVTRVSLRNAIDLVAKAARVRVGYRKEVLDAIDGPVTLQVKDATLGRVLDGLLAGTQLQAVPVAEDMISIEPATVGHQQSESGIAGRVTDARTRRPIVGASVTLDDSAKVVRTDDAGRYHFSGVAAGAHRVTVRVVGYARQTRGVTVAEGRVTTEDLVLSATVNTLDQVVVTATGEQRIRELGHVVSQINVDSLVKAAPISSVSDLLQSRVPGLHVTTANGGMAGGDVSLRIRGVTSLTLDAEPIVIVDGVRYRSNNMVADGATVREDLRGYGELQNPLNMLNPNDIATIEIVKGPSASTLYGPDAANGVIVITTKRGVPGDAKFQWYARPVSNSVPKTRIERGYQAWGHTSSGALYNGNCTVLAQYQYGDCTLDSITTAPTAVGNTDYSILAKSRPTWQYGASFNGGVQAVRYFLSGNYDTQVGALQLGPAVQRYLKEQLGASALTSAVRTPNTLQNIGTHANLSADVGSHSNVGLTANYLQSNHRTLTVDGGMLYSRGAPAPGIDSTSPYYLLYLGVSPGYTMLTTEETENHFNGALNGTTRPFSWLTATGSVGVDIDGTVTHSVLPPGIDLPDRPSIGVVKDDRRNNVGRTLTGNATASFHPGAFSFRTTLGTQYNYAHLDGLSGYAQNLALGSIAINYGSYQSLYPLWNETASLGTYGEEVIGLRDRLFLTGALRLDGSTSFGDDYHARPYPKIGLSWIASDEPWLKGLPGLHELRFRTSFGAASRYPTSEMKLGTQSGGRITVRGNSQAYLLRQELANPLLQPERTRETEFGADATVLSDVAIGLTWNQRRSNDVLGPLGYPPGLPSVWANIGDIKGHGFEATVSVPLIDAHSVRADVQFAYSSQSTKVLSLGGLPENKSPSASGYAIGYPVGSVFAYRILGVADTVGHHQDGIIFSNEVVRDSVPRFIGVAVPPKTFTVTPAVSVLNGRVRLSALFDRETDFLVYDQTSANCGSSGLCLAPFLTTTAPLLQAKYASFGRSDDWWVPGDFTRFREFSASVDIPDRFLHWDAIHLRFSRATFSVQGRNLALWTKYKGTDPESTTWNQGFLPDQGTGIPQARAWGFRFDVTP